MKVNDPNMIVCSSGLLSVVEKDNCIRITLKNKTTLDIIPRVDEEGKFVGYDYNYMTAQQNRKINSLKEKMAKLQSEMEGIITSEDIEEDNEEVEDGEESEILDELEENEE